MGSSKWRRNQLLCVLPGEAETEKGWVQRKSSGPELGSIYSWFPGERQTIRWTERNSSLSGCTLHEARRTPQVYPGPASGKVFDGKHNRHWTISGKKRVERRHALLEERRKRRGSTQGLETRLEQMRPGHSWRSWSQKLLPSLPWVLSQYKL